MLTHPRTDLPPPFIIVSSILRTLVVTVGAIPPVIFHGRNLTTYNKTVGRTNGRHAHTKNKSYQTQSQCCISEMKARLKFAMQNHFQSGQSIKGDKFVDVNPYC